MKLLQQPRPSRTCGHHCVAMVTGQPVEKIIEMIGHQKGTRAEELIKVLVNFGYTAHYLPFKGLPYLTDICIIGIKWNRGGHWRVLNNGIIYDPCFPVTFPYEDSCHREDGGKYNQAINLFKNQ